MAGERGPVKFPTADRCDRVVDVRVLSDPGIAVGLSRAEKSGGLVTLRAHILGPVYPVAVRLGLAVWQSAPKCRLALAFRGIVDGAYPDFWLA